MVGCLSMTEILFRCRLPITQVVKYGDDFTGWTQIKIPAIDPKSVIINRGILLNQVSVVSPSLGPKIFVRLKETQ